MKTQRPSQPRAAFLAGIIFSLCLQISANHTEYPRAMNATWSPIGQSIGGSQSPAEANTTAPPSANFSSKPVTASDLQTAPPQPPATGPNSSTISPAPGAAPATGGPRNTSKPKTTTTKETCEDNKFLILICFIIIAALVLICTFLFLSTVVVANKLSYLKKAQQGKRRPRSNGDILATNSLWPTAAGTWQRMPKEATGTDLIMQDLLSGRGAAIQTKTQDETTQRLTEDTATEHESREPMSRKSIVTDFVVEI
ncbi:EVI2A protein, partial [Alectura lathami]|nr:EVI2A protein [Alectura lathami]